MLYIFDLGNVIVNIDFQRVLAVWSDLGGVPLSEIRRNFTLEADAFKQHERGEISDQQFAQAINQALNLNLSFEQFTEGWLAIFLDSRHQVIKRMQQLKAQGNRVVILSNTNALHTQFWPENYPEVIAAADKVYLSHQIGMRKPEARIYQHVLQQENTSAQQALFFDDNQDNINAAKQLGIESILVTSPDTIEDYFQAV